MSQAPPILDFSAFYANDPVAKSKLVDDVRKSCLHNGFFQIVGHQVPLTVQENALASSKQFFTQPPEEKLKCRKELNAWNRGYEVIRSQMLEIGTSPDLKEGFYIGEDIPKSHPYFMQKKLNSGPNVWPENMSEAEEFKSASMEYYQAVGKLAKDVLVVLALTLDLPETISRLLPSDSDEKLSRGIGAHTDFDAVTLLLQDEVVDLQVWEKDTNTWLDVAPTKDVYVVNLGNIFMRWSNDRYISNLHRVINKSGKERYSIPFFFSGNPDYVIECLPNCRDKGQPAKYPPVTVQQAVSASYEESYGRAEKYKKEAQTPLVTTKGITA